jgi:hypothetical protein
MIDRWFATNTSEILTIALVIACVYVIGIATGWHLARRVIAQAVKNLTATINDGMTALNSRHDQFEHSVEERLTRIEALAKSKQ